MNETNEWMNLQHIPLESLCLGFLLGAFVASANPSTATVGTVFTTVTVATVVMATPASVSTETVGTVTGAVVGWADGVSVPLMMVNRGFGVEVATTLGDCVVIALPMMDLSAAEDFFFFPWLCFLLLLLLLLCFDFAFFLATCAAACMDIISTPLLWRFSAFSSLPSPPSPPSPPSLSPEDSLFEPSPLTSNLSIASSALSPSMRELMPDSDCSFPPNSYIDEDNISSTLYMRALTLCPRVFWLKPQIF